MPSCRLKLLPSPRVQVSRVQVLGCLEWKCPESKRPVVQNPSFQSPSFHTMRPESSFFGISLFWRINFVKKIAVLKNSILHSSLNIYFLKVWYVFVRMSRMWLRKYAFYFAKMLPSVWMISALFYEKLRLSSSFCVAR